MLKKVKDKFKLKQVMTMSKKSTRRILATTLTLCLVASMLIPMATITSSAKISLTTFDGFVTNQIYSRGMATTGKVLKSLGEATGNATVMQITSFINSKVCNNSDTTDKIKETCDTILEVVDDMEDIVEDINADLKSDEIKKSAKEYKEAWDEQVLNVMKSGDGKESFYGVYDAYLEYLECASDPEEMDDDETLEDYEEAYVSELEKYYSHINNDYYQNSCLLSKNEYCEYEMYTTGAVDEGISGIISTMLYNMNPEKSSIGSDGNLGNRFVDKAAQYAYYAFPYSSEQAEFVDDSVECQLNMITTLVMIYQDFLSRKADYYLDINYAYNNFIANENIDRATLSDSDKALYDRMCEIKQDANESTSQKAKYEDALDDIKINYATIDKCNATLNEYYDATGSTDDYVGMLDKYQKNVEKFMEGDLYLCDVKAHTTLDKYVRDDSVTVSDDDDKTTYTLKNKNYKDFYLYDGNHGSQANVSGELNNFYKNASVKAENGELVFRPFYVLNGDTQDLDMGKFDILKKCGNGTIFGGVFNAHYLTMDYQNFKQSLYTDGVNQYAPITEPNQLKSLINETYYTAYKCTPYSYFAPFMKYASDKTNYLLLNGTVDHHDPIEGVSYFKIPVFNMNSSDSYATGWSAQSIDYDSFPGAVYSLILAPKSTETKSTVNVKIEGEGEVTVENSTPLAGGKVKVTVNAPENYKIEEIRVQYFNDPTNTSKVTSEKQISTSIDTNKYTLDYRVPYTKTTIVVKTSKVPQQLNKDENGNYLVTSYADLCNMVEMVNSEYKEYAKASYVLTNDIDCAGNDWQTPIGTDEYAFEGLFDGQGHKISNMSFDNTQGNYVGLFGNVKNATIKNVALETKSNVQNSNVSIAGSICANADHSLISNCKVTGFMCIYQTDYYGGAVGLAKESIVEKCMADLYLFEENVNKIGGICGGAINSKITNCAFVDNKIGVVRATAICGICGEASEETSISDCYFMGDMFASESYKSFNPITVENDGITVENCYYQANCNYTTVVNNKVITNSGEPDKTYGTEATAEQFESGEITSLLNKGITDGTQAWSQNIGTDAYPIITNN